jgi:hypothetical protein
MTAGLRAFFLAPVMFFLGVILYNLCRFSEKTKAKQLSNWVLLAFSALVIVFYASSVKAVFGDGGLTDLVKQGVLPSDKAVWYANLIVSAAVIGQMIVFGFMPLTKAINKTLVHSDKHDLPIVEAAKNAEKQRLAEAAAEEQRAAEAAAKKAGRKTRVSKIDTENNDPFAYEEPVVKTRKPRTPKTAPTE